MRTEGLQGRVSLRLLSNMEDPAAHLNILGVLQKREVMAGVKALRQNVDGPRTQVRAGAGGSR